MAINVSTKPEKSTLNIKERGTIDSTEKYSSPLLNYNEVNRIDNIDYTKFYTEVDTNLSVGERVYIVNGNYDTYDIIKENMYRKGTNGYTILEIDKCSITLDIEYTGISTWLEDDFDNYIKVYGCDGPHQKDYEIQQNGYYPYKYMYGYRGNNNILYCNNKFEVADPSFINIYWIDITTQFLSNNFPTFYGSVVSGLDITPNNGKLLIMQEFTHNGDKFEKGYVYKFEDGKWIKDNKSRKSYLTKGNFRDGSFINGNWNDGIFGQFGKKINWTGSKWRNGIFYNSNWINGTMESKSDSIYRQSYYTNLSDDGVSYITDFNNNYGFGYNFSEDSYFENANIININSNNCIFGSYSGTASVMRKHLEGTTPPFGINIKNGKYVDSHIEDSYIEDGLYEYSDIVNSKSINGRFTDTNIKYSVTSGDYVGLGSISIKGYDKLITSEEFLYDNPHIDPTDPISYSGTQPLVINHKFYISNEDLLKIRSGIWISLNNLVTDNPEILNFLDNSFYLGTDVNGNPYIADNYGKRPEGVSIQLKSKEQNSILRVLPPDNIFPNFIEKKVSKPSASIDLFIHLESIVDTNSDLVDYRNSTSFDVNYTQSINEYREGKLQISTITKSIHNGGRWEADKVNNPDYQIDRSGTSSEYLSMEFNSGLLKVTLNDFSNILKNDQLEIGDVIILDNITYVDGGSLYPVNGEYILDSFTQNPLILSLQDLGSQSIAGSYSPGGSFISSFIVNGNTYDTNIVQDTFNSIHLEKIENTEINQGFIKRGLFKSNIIKNDLFETQMDLSIRNVNLLKISEMSIDENTDLIIKSGLFIRTFIKDTIWDDGIVYRSILRNSTIKGGIVKNSHWIGGTFDDGIFMDSMKDYVISDPLSVSRNFTNLAIKNEWLDGEFNGGEFINSIWDNGEFNGGEFYNSIFAGGNWYNGRFGNIEYSNSSSMFGHPKWTHESVNTLGHNIPTWHDGTFINGEFGMRSNGTSNPSPSIGPIEWHGGSFRDGTIISFTQSTPVIWHDGIFNNGDIVGYVQWKNGTFNQGKFRSAWGTGYGVNSTDYAWEDGLFNNGRFGENGGVVSVGVDINTNATSGLTYSLSNSKDNINILQYDNPSWFGGRFNDGYFFGKIWNDGIFTGGRFIGNTQSSFNISYNEKFKSPPTNLPDRESNRRTAVIINQDLGEYILDRMPDILPHSSNPLNIFSKINMVPSPNDTSNSFNFSKDWVSINSDNIGGGTVVIFSTNDKDYLISPNIPDSVSSLEFDYLAESIGIPYSSSTTGNTTNDYFVFNIFKVEIIDNLTDNILGTYTKSTYVYEDSSLIFHIDTNIDRGKFKINLPSPIKDFKVKMSCDISGEVGILVPPLPAQYKPGVVSDYKFLINDIKMTTTDTHKRASVPDQFVMDYSTESTVPYFGMWRNGKVISDNTIDVSTSNFMKLSQLESVRRFKGETSPNVFFENALWVDGEFNSYGQMDNTVWLNGSFKNGNFINSSFNPYVPRWDFGLTGGSKGSLGSPTSGHYQYALTQSCIWKTGYLDNSDFHISEWNSGIFNKGNMIGGNFKGGVSNYMNAYNIIWSGGKWRNGNWYGANIISNEIYSGTSSMVMKESLKTDQIVTNSHRYKDISGNNISKLFIWNVMDSDVPTKYLDSPTTYGYSDYNHNHISSSFINNDYILVGDLSLITDNNRLKFTPSDLSKNSLNGLNFDNDIYGYDMYRYGIKLPTKQIIGTMSPGNELNTYWGNGSFIEGVWENGVWNNGIRTDNVFDSGSKLVEMDSISNYFQTAPNKWNVEIKGYSSLSNFKNGDYISIGNIIGITVNDVRKQLKDSYQIIKIVEIDNVLTITIKTPFPLKSIEKDSENHLILVTKNVWENGIFHNGKFEGVWNSGKVEGYPFITVLENTQWIDGTFDGGKFYATQSTDFFGTTYSTGLIQNADINLRNTKGSNIFETWMDINYTDETYSHIWDNSGGQTPNIEVTKDILSSNTNIWIGNGSSRISERLKLGWKKKLYDDLIDDDLKLYPPETLSSRGWDFGTLNMGVYTSLTSSQTKFSGYDISGQYPTDNIRIDLNEDNNSPSNDSKYSIKNDKLNILNKGRYWELSYNIIEVNSSSGPDAYITPYPSKGIYFGVTNSNTNPYIQGNVKAYHWNFPGNTPIINLSEVVGNIGDIKFTEVDYIPFYDYTGGDPYTIETDIQLPKTSQSSEIRISERDAKFIDNKISRI